MMNYEKYLKKIIILRITYDRTLVGELRDVSELRYRWTENQ